MFAVSLTLVKRTLIWWERLVVAFDPPQDISADEIVDTAVKDSKKSLWPLRLGEVCYATDNLIKNLFDKFHVQVTIMGPVAADSVWLRASSDMVDKILQKLDGMCIQNATSNTVLTLCHLSNVSIEGEGVPKPLRISACCCPTFTRCAA